MINHPNLDSLFKLVDDIKDLQRAEDLLEEVWSGQRGEVKLPFELSMKLDEYFEVDDSE
jgi:hypothetical protein